MNIKRITAIVPLDVLSPLENYLRDCAVPGVTVEVVTGYGEHPNYFRRDLMRENARVILYVEAERVDTIITAIQECTQESQSKAGILAVDAVERLVNLTAH